MTATLAAGAAASAKPGSSSCGKPLTYLRQVVALLLDPELLASSGQFGAYPPDVVAKARKLLAEFPGSSVGSYTHTGGHQPVREACARYLLARDGGSRVGDVQVTCGSTEAIRLLLEGFGRRRPTPAGVLVPSPGCGMYADFARQVGVLPTAYRLDGPLEGWQICESELEVAYQAALAAGSEPRLLVVINPGSPAGQLLTEASLRCAAKFALRRGLLVIADETLQFAVHSSDFVGFRKVVLNSPEPLNSLEVASLASLSRGPTCGEAGLRVGFCELLNLHPAAVAGLLAVLACTSCPPVVGQAALAAALDPPLPGEASHDRYAEELSMAQTERRRRAALVAEQFDLPTPPAAGGSAYAKLHAPPRLISIANELAEPLDTAFCRILRERTGVAAVLPGTRFGHGPGDEGTFFVSFDFQSAGDDKDLLEALNGIKTVLLELAQ